MDYENQQLIERTYNSKQQLPLFKHYFEQKGVKDPLILQVLANMAIHRSCTVQTMLGLTKRACNGDLNVAAKLIEDCITNGLITYDENTDRLGMRFDVDQKTRDIAAKYMYMPPMIVPPKTLTCNTSSALLTIEKDSLLLNDNHHEEDICLTSINKFNQIALKINPEVVKNVRNCWKHMDKQKEDESFEEFIKRVKSFEKYEKNSFWVMALMIEMGNQFWVPHKDDKRGRSYAQGYHINPQGNAWNKACLEFYNEEVVEC